MNGILVLLSTVTLVSGVALETKPLHKVVVAGQDSRFNCTPDGPLSPQTLIWREMISNPLGAIIYKSDMSGPNDPEDYAIVNQYDLVVRTADLMDGGWYSCALSSDDQPSPARLVVVEPPVIIQNMVDFVEGQVYNLGCSVRYGAPEQNTEEVNLPVLRVNIDNRIIGEHTMERTVGQVGVDASSYSVSFNFTALPEHHGKEVDCTASTELPEFHTTSSSTLFILHGVNSVNVVNEREKYRVGETIECSANGHPAPTYTWKSEKNGKEIGGDKLRVTDEMVGSNEWTCMANNTVQGVVAHKSVTISFRAEERSTNGASPVWTLNALLCMLMTVVLGYVF